MFHFLDDDTDMYNTPYTYNAGRMGFLACHDYTVSSHAWKNFPVIFFFTTLSARFQSLQLGRCFFSFLSMYNERFDLFSWK